MAAEGRRNPADSGQSHKREHRRLIQGDLAARTGEAAAKSGRGEAAGAGTTIVKVPAALCRLPRFDAESRVCAGFATCLAHSAAGALAGRRIVFASITWVAVRLSRR